MSDKPQEPIEKEIEFNVRLVSGTSYRNVPPVTEEEKAKYPFVLYANLRPPLLASVAWIFAFGGSEDLTIRGDTVETLQAFAKYNQLPSHPRLRRLQISDQDGKVIWSLVPDSGWKEGDVPS